MHVGRTRVPVVPILVGILLLLVPALAWLQYQWVGQLSQAERERMQRTLRTAASQFAIEFDTELSKALGGLQVEGPSLIENDWSGFAQRYSAWREAASEPRLVRDVLLVDAIGDISSPATSKPRVATAASASADTAAKTATVTINGHTAVGVFEYRVTERRRATVAAISRLLANDQPIDPNTLRLRRWNASTLQFEAAEWSPDIAPLKASIANQLGEIRVLRGQGGARGRREATPVLSLSDDHTLISPVPYFDASPLHDGPPRIAVLGFVLVRLDQEVIRATVLPLLAARHLHSEDGADYRVAIVNRSDPSRVIWESEPDAAKTIGSAPDVSQDFMGGRPDRMFVFSRDGGERRAAGPPPPPPATQNYVVSMIDRRDLQNGAQATYRERVFSPLEGKWTLTATHRAGSLEAAVASVRTRNLALSSSILLLLTMVVGLIVVSTRRAQSLARQQMEFVAAVSHELRTPVSVIGAAAGNLADGVVEDPQRVRKYGETIQREARRLGETVERVLQLAGIAAGRAAATPATVDPGELVMQSVRACQAEIEAAGTTVETDIAPGLPLVQGDVVALRSAMQNLISNAVKYGGDARWLRITVFANGEPRTANRVSFVVEDHGLGIDGEDRDHIFEPFYRGREAVSRQIHGSGLGLNLVKRIAEAHGGSVTVSSEAGTGSTFTLTLPAAIDRAAVAHAPSAVEASF